MHFSVLLNANSYCNQIYLILKFKKIISQEKAAQRRSMLDESLGLQIFRNSAKILVNNYITSFGNTTCVINCVLLEMY